VVFIYRRNRGGPEGEVIGQQQDFLFIDLISYHDPAHRMRALLSGGLTGEPDQLIGKNVKEQIMQRTLGDITRELRDGIIKPAEKQAQQLLADARREADDIRAEARKQADEMIYQAEQNADRIKKQMESDMDVAARNFLLKVQEKLESSVVTPVLNDEIRKTATDPGFLARMIEQVLTAYAGVVGEETKIDLLLPSNQKEELEAWCLEIFRDKMSGNVDVNFTDKVSFGFKLGVKGTGTQFNFSNGLVEAFSDFCSPRFRKHFFDSKEK
jgi:V/A-type H+-transporting ATPase subunit E